MIDYQKQFLDWLEKNPDKKKGLTEWERMAKIIKIVDDNKINKAAPKKTLEIDFTEAIHLSRKWKNIKNRLLEYWKTLSLWAVTEKHDFSLGINFHEWDYFIRHYQNSTEELVTEVKQLKSEKKRLEDKVTGLEEALEIERETNQESAEMMDDFYRMAPPREDVALENILKEISDDYLTLNWENKNLKQIVKELKSTLDLVEQLVDLKIKEEKMSVQFEVPSK